MSQGFSIKLQNQDLDQPFVVESPGDLDAFLTTESALWEAWAKDISKSELGQIQPVRSLMQTASQRWSSTHRAVHELLESGESSIEAIRNATNLAVEALKNNETMISHSPIGAIVLELAKDKPDASAAIWAMATRESMHVLSNFYPPQSMARFYRSLATALPAVLSSSAGAAVHAESALNSRIIAERARDETATIRDEAAAFSASNSEHLSNAIRSTDAAFADEVRKLDQSAKEALEAVNKDWVALRRAYDIKLKTKAPFSYWRGKRLFHRMAAKAWGSRFLAAIIVGGFSIVGLAIEYGDQSAHGPLPWLLPVCVVGVPAFFFLWIARIANRKYNDHLLRAEDAHERGIMVKTLLALARKDASESAISDVHMTAVLNALFRPGPGLGPDDSPSVSMAENLFNTLRGGDRHH